MKIIVFQILLLLCGYFVYSQESGQKVTKAKLIVYYFHLTNRCPTCTKIEAVTRKVLNENFKAEMDSGIIVFKAFNVDLAENKEISEKYDAYGATLALTWFISGKEKIEDLTNFAFAKIHNEQAFVSGLTSKIQEHIK